MPTYKVFLIQLLNIAGVGPVFGPIMGALYGPTALLWIVLGSIFAGGVHDYFSGMLSERYLGKSTPDVVGYTLGNIFKQIMRAFAIVLLILVGVVFVTAPAGLLQQLTGWNMMTWVAIIFIVLWTAAAYLVKKGTVHWIASIPATIMTAIVVTYIFYEPNVGFGVNLGTSNIIGYVAAAVALVAFVAKKSWFVENVKLELPYPNS